MQELQEFQRGDDGIGVLVQRCFQSFRGVCAFRSERQWNWLCHVNLSLPLRFDLDQFAREAIAGLPPFFLDVHAALWCGMAEAMIDARQRTLAGSGEYRH